MIEVGRSAELVEGGIFRAAAGFFRGSSKVLERDAPRSPVPGSNPVHGFGGGVGTRLSAIYGDRLRIVGSGPGVEQHLRDLERLPDSIHNKLLGHFAGHPKGGIDIVDGPVTDVMSELRGVTPRGWPPGKTWDDVPGLYDPSTHRVIVSGGGGGHGCVSLVLHETGHAFDSALGDASSSVEFRQLRDGMDTTNPYYAQPGEAGREEVFAEGFAAWAHNRHMPAAYRANAIADALDIGALKESRGARFDSYFLNLKYRLDPRPL
jgi:hypothetical protein